MENYKIHIEKSEDGDSYTVRIDDSSQLKSESVVDPMMT